MESRDDLVVCLCMSAVRPPEILPRVRSLLLTQACDPSIAIGKTPEPVGKAWTMTRPLKAISPPAPTSRDTLKSIHRIQKLYQLRQRLVQTAVKELSRVLPETARRPNSRAYGRYAG